MSQAEKIKTVQALIVKQEKQFNVIAPQSIEFQREASFALQILSTNDYLASVAYSNQDSLKSAIMNIANVGLSLNPVKKHAYLIPRKGKVCLDVSYLGYVQLALESGNIHWVKAEIVHEKDEFFVKEFGEKPHHSFNPFSERGAIVGAYCIAKLDSGDFISEFMSIADIYSIRNRSESYKTYVEKKKLCPWVTDEGEMIKKTVIRRAYKSWPIVNKSRFEAAIEDFDDDFIDTKVVQDKKTILLEDNEDAKLIESAINKINKLGKDDDYAFEFLCRYFKRKIENYDELTNDELKRFNVALDMSLTQRVKQDETNGLQDEKTSLELETIEN